MNMRPLIILATAAAGVIMCALLVPVYESLGGELDPILGGVFILAGGATIGAISGILLTRRQEPPN